MARTVETQSVDSNGVMTVTFDDGSVVSGRPLSAQEMFQLFVQVAQEDGPEALREIMTAFYQMRSRINAAQNQAIFEAEQALNTSENKEASRYLRWPRAGGADFLRVLI